MFAAVLVLAQSPGYGQSHSERMRFDIPSQSVPQALDAFARQANLVLGFSEFGYENVQTRAVVGSFRPERALELLLSGTGLSVKIGADDRVIVLRASQTQESEKAGATMDRDGSELTAKAGGDGRSASFATGSADGAQGRSTVDTRRSSAPEGDEILDEVVVTGSHIRGIDTVGASSLTFTREEIDSTGYSTVQDLFESLPQNLDEISPDGSVATGASEVANGNTQGASSISLRGLGPGSTLILLNGKRRPGNIRGRAVDVSAIPLSMVERLDVITGGASAVYGSDAVAGVVNIVTVTELDGAESQIYAGEASAGGERLNFSQTFGRSFEKGGFVLGYDYRKDEPLDATATGVVRPPSPSGLTPSPGLFDLIDPSEQHVGLFSGRYEVGQKVELYGDAHYSSDENEVVGIVGIAGCCDVGTIGVTKSDQYSVAGGIRFDYGEDWQVDVSVLHGVVENSFPFVFNFAGEGTITSRDAAPLEQDEDEATITSFSAIADGPVGRIGSRAISSAVGVEFREESYERQRFSLPDFTPFPAQNENRDREIWAVFGEVHVPLVDRDGQRLELSLAGRYEDYSDFGNTFNPRIGLDWELAGGLVVRGSFSRAFRAPDLFILDFANQTLVRELADPLDPTGMTVASVFVQTGGNPDLQPEEADSYTIGIDWEASDQTSVSLSYFNIGYEGRIGEPTPSSLTVLEEEALFSELINRSPTPAELDAFLAASTGFLNGTAIPFDPETDDAFATFANIIVFDNRRNNIALEKLDGIDFQVATELEAGSSEWSFGLNSTYYLGFNRKITATSPSIEQLNKPGRTIDLRVRGQIGWSRSAWRVFGYVNYVNDYDDSLASTPTKIDSWTTVDLTVRYDAIERNTNGFLDGLRATLAVENLFDEDPPVFLSNSQGLGYDTANANALGRFVSLRLSKRW